MHICLLSVEYKTNLQSLNNTVLMHAFSYQGARFVDFLSYVKGLASRGDSVRQNY